METAIQTKPTRVPKERPILFSAPMVQAILEGRKTQTRRAVKPKVSQLIDVFLGGDEDTDISFGYLDDLQDEDGNHEPAGWYVWCTDYPYECAMHLGQCPYGMAGDQFWVREAWQYSDDLDEPYWYRQKESVELKPEYFERMKWKPSIHMPREASRILLEITDIRVEQLQEISEEDAGKEGLWLEPVVEGTKPLWRYSSESDWYSHASKCFEGLWQSINGEGSWSANPWVWVVEFKVLEVKSGL